MRAIEAAAIAAGAVTGGQLMERAGAGAVAALHAEWPDLAARPARAVVLCGPGNNGGDGYVVARLLAARGWDVRLHSADWQDILARRVRPGDAGAAARAWVAAGGDARPMQPRALAASLGGDGWPVVLVDALLGTGQNRAADAILAPLNAALDWREGPGGLRTLALDIPTGIDADTGAALARQPVEADLTVTFHAPKPGHLAGAGRAASGRVVVVDIGLPRASS
jgi:hydroxyethylthiazole kinase-like uncharacterized protein yjeF